MLWLNLLLIHWLFLPAPPRFDLCIYGGTAAGIVAAYTAGHAGLKVVLIEPSLHLGGMTTSGLGFTDIGNKYVVSGVARDFYRRVGQHYGRFEQWTFEPHVAQKIMADYLRHPNIQVWRGWVLRQVQKKGTILQSLQLEAQQDSSQLRQVKAKIFIDCSYEGDLMALAGVPFRVGREANAAFGETHNGVQRRDKHQFPAGIDPYRRPGDPHSGLLWGISGDSLGQPGSGDHSVQAYNFRLCLTNDPNNRCPIARPPGYDSTHYALLARYLAARPGLKLNQLLTLDPMPNHKTDTNNNGPFSTDYIGANHAYPTASPRQRRAIVAAHRQYTQGLLYFLANDPRVPAALRAAMAEWGLPRDEFTTTDHWPPQLYVREARRMQGQYTMTELHCTGQRRAPDSIALAAYTMDSHNTRRLVVDGAVQNEGDVQVGGFPPYPIGYGAIIPTRLVASNLLVPVCLSATHIAFGSIRMEPIFMVLGQVAAVAAGVALRKGCTVQAIPVPALLQELRRNPFADGRPAEVLLDNDITPAAITTSGPWKTETKGGSQFGAAYGRSMLVDTSQGRVAGVVAYRFSPTRSGRYRLLLYLAQGGIRCTGELHTSPAAPAQPWHLAASNSSGQWQEIGIFTLKKGQPVTLTIKTQEGQKSMADAVLWVPLPPWP